MLGVNDEVVVDGVEGDMLGVNDEVVVDGVEGDKGPLLPAELLGVNANGEDEIEAVDTGGDCGCFIADRRPTEAAERCGAVFRSSSSSLSSSSLNVEGAVSGTTNCVGSESGKSRAEFELALWHAQCHFVS